MGFEIDTGKRLKQLLIADPKMPMAVCTKGYFAMLMGNAKFTDKAMTTSKQLNEIVKNVSVSPREHQHAVALSFWACRNLEKATNIWENILLQYPLDGLAARLAHFAHFYSGNGRQMRESAARLVPYWPKTHSDFGFVLGMHAFGLEEADSYREAEKYGRWAVEINPKDIWSAHAVAHVMEMMGRKREGINWIKKLEPNWKTVNNFRYHLCWHQCLYHLELGEFAEVLKVYDEKIVADLSSDFYLDVCNASSLLWRLEILGVEIGERWHSLQDISAQHIGDMELIFVSLHYLMVLSAGGRTDLVNEMITNIRRWSTLDTSQSKIIADVGLSMAKGLHYARKNELYLAIEKIEQVRGKIESIGGSKAQRDVFDMILLDAVQKSNMNQKASDLFAERVRKKPHSFWSWSSYSCALSKLGKAEAAEDALRRSQAIIEDY